MSLDNSGGLDGGIYTGDFSPNTKTLRVQLEWINATYSLLDGTPIIIVGVVGSDSYEETMG